MKAFTVSILVGLLSSLLVVPHTRAGPVTWTFMGEVQSLRDDLGLLGGRIAPGTPFSGSFTFDPMVADGDPGDPAHGRYGGAIIDMHGRVGDVAYDLLAPTSSVVDVADDSAFPYAEHLAFEAEIGVLGHRLDIQVLLLNVDFARDTLSNDGIPGELSEVEGLVARSLRIADSREEIPLGIVGPIGSLVPEPVTLLLLAVGIGVSPWPCRA